MSPVCLTGDSSSKAFLVQIRDDLSPRTSLLEVVVTPMGSPETYRTRWQTHQLHWEGAIVLTASAKGIAHQIDLLTPLKRSLDEGDDFEDSEIFLLEFWETFIHIARQIPSEHAS